MITPSRSCSRWIKVLVATSALIVFFLSMPAGRTSTVGAQSGERAQKLTMPAAEYVRAPLLKSPPVISAEEKARLQAVQAQLHRPGPPTRVDPRAAPRAELASPPASVSRAAATLPKPRAGSSTNAPGDFTVFQTADLHSVVSHTTSVIAEPSVQNIGSVVLETGNSFAALSRDGGNIFTYLDPFTTFPSVYGGFCCDQRVLYDSSRNLMFWALMYYGNSSGNMIRLAIARGEAALKAPFPVFISYGFSPQAVGFPAGEWYDYPQIALSSNYLYFTANVFKAPFPSGPFDRTVVLRLPLDGLASGIGFEYDAFTMDSTYFNATPVQGATNTMYWATQGNTAIMRVYQWPESSPQPTAAVVVHTYYPDPSNPAGYTCPIGGVQDWCGRLDDRVQTGWLSGGTLGFVWSAPKGTGGFGTFNFPFVQFLFVNSYTLTFTGESIMWNPAFAYAYPSAALNAWGHVAGTVFYGGGATPPTLAAFIWDNYSSPPYPQIPGTPLGSWEVRDIPGAVSSQGPTESICPNCWGDYLSASIDRTSVFSRFLWTATGYTLQGGGTNGNIHPYYLRFGRAANDPVLVELNNKPLYLPLTRKSQ